MTAAASGAMRYAACAGALQAVKPVAVRGLAPVRGPGLLEAGALAHTLRVLCEIWVLFKRGPRALCEEDGRRKAYVSNREHVSGEELLVVSEVRVKEGRLLVHPRHVLPKLFLQGALKLTAGAHCRSWITKQSAPKP